jgi:hypothetical protein
MGQKENSTLRWRTVKETPDRSAEYRGILVIASVLTQALSQVETPLIFK